MFRPRCEGVDAPMSNAIPKIGVGPSATPITRRVRINPRKPPTSPDAIEQRENAMIAAT